MKRPAFASMWPCVFVQVPAEFVHHLAELCTPFMHSTLLTEISIVVRGLQSEEKVAVAAGKKPYFLGKAEKRKRELVAKYEELKSAGKLDKYMEKRRKKNAAKDHRYLPSSRRPMGGE